MTVVAIDLDGVLADFETGFRSICGRYHRDLTDPEIWQAIEPHPDFFERLPLMRGALDLFHSISTLCMEHLGSSPFILTACPAHSQALFTQTAACKRRWVRQHLGQYVGVVTSIHGQSKATHIPAPGAVLIDDWPNNVQDWLKAGGHAILHRNNTQTLEELRKLLSRRASQ